MNYLETFVRQLHEWHGYIVRRVKRKILSEEKMIKNAIPEECGLLRTIQMTICSYSRPKDR